MDKPTKDQEAGLFIALLADLAHHDNPTLHGNLIAPDTARAALDTISDGLLRADPESVIAAIEGAANHQVTRRPAPEPYTGNPQQWFAWPGYRQGIRDFEIVSGTLPNSQPDDLDTHHSQDTAHAAWVARHRCDDLANCSFCRAPSDAGPRTQLELVRQRQLIATMDITHRTGYIMGVLAAMDRHFGPKPPF